MKRIPTLQTKRLVLRPFAPGDAADVQRLAGDPAIADTTLQIPHPYPDGAAEAWIAGHAEAFAAGREMNLAVTDRAAGALVGVISLMDIEAGHQAELGCWIGKPFWGRGYCTEAARGILHLAFAELELQRVHSCHFVRNPASGRVLAKAGLSREGMRRRHVRKGDRYEDLELYGILRDEWNNDAHRGE